MMVDRVHRPIRLGLLAYGFLLLPALASAQELNVCLTASNGSGDPIPNCEVQTQAPVPYGRAETKGWAYYCTGDHPYYWGYPGYDYLFPSSYGYYEVTEGALSIDMFDLANAANNNNNIKGIWNGLIRGSGIFRVENANDGVKILFDQSTYLKTN